MTSFSSISTRPGLPADLGKQLRGAITSQFGQRFDAVATFEAGHAAGLVAMQAALTKLTAGTFEACVVAGVDSYLMPATLAWLEEHDQLHGAGRLNNAWGLVPGEGSGAALLTVGRVVERLGIEPLGRVLSVGNGFETDRIKTQTVCIGEGLTATFR